MLQQQLYQVPAAECVVPRHCQLHVSIIRHNHCHLAGQMEAAAVGDRVWIQESMGRVQGLERIGVPGEPRAAAGPCTMA